jgi:choline dehydrogenase-like flavoprotein
MMNGRCQPTEGIQLHTKQQHGEKFDIVIVGAGPSAMGIIYSLLESHLSNNNCHGRNDNDNTLTALPFSIAIVERGVGPPHHPLTQQPRRWYEAAHCHDSASVQLYDASITGRQLDVPVGKGLGGTSNINACLCLPPLKEDTDNWPEPWKSTLEKDAEYLLSVMDSNGVLHYGNVNLMGNTNLCFGPSSSSLQLTSKIPTLVSRDPATGKFVRSNYYSALVEPVCRHNLFLQPSIRWYRGFEAQRLISKGKLVSGVECMNLSDEFILTLYATKRVILCAGAIETPALLLVSLPSHDHLSGIGKNLKDQSLLARAHFRLPWLMSRESTTDWSDQSVSGIVALGHWRHPNQSLFQVAVADSVSLPSILPGVVGMAVRWKCGSKYLSFFLDVVSRTIRYTARLGMKYTPIGWIFKHCITVTMVFLMQPHSNGQVSVHPKNVTGFHQLCRKDVEVHVEPGYLHERQDFLSLKAAWDGVEIPTSMSFIEFFPKPILFLLGLLIPKDKAFRIYCHCFLQPYYHFAGSCAMSNTTARRKDWVVESATLKVRGYDGLYICDASVFPSMISNPPALTCASLGYRFGKMIVAEDHDSSHFLE